jgi:hypothetical protein
MKSKIVMISLIVVLLSACTNSAPETLVQELGAALNAGDVDAAMALMADNAVFTVDFAGNLELYNGSDEIRTLYSGLVAGNFRIETTPESIEGNTVTTLTKTWGDGVPGDGPNTAVEVYVVEDGKIASITWTPTDETIAKYQAMMAEAATPEIIITFDGERCVYNGPESLPAGEVTFILDVEDKAEQTEHDLYGVDIVFLDEDKGFEDLDAWTSLSRPSWVTSLAFLEAMKGNSDTSTFSLAADRGPLYFACFFPTEKLITLGPIDIQ